MKLQDFEEKYKDFKSDVKIEVECDVCQKQIEIGKRYAKTNIKRNISRHNKEEFICESCYKSMYNGMKLQGKVPKPTDIITVKCLHPEHDGDRSRQIQWSAYKGPRIVEGDYEQVCNTCWQLGKEISQEQRDKISESLMGHVRTQESIDKQVETWRSNPDNVAWASELGMTYNDHYTNGMLGKKHTDETKERMSKIKTGKKKTPEQILNMSIAQTKRQQEHPHSVETRKKIGGSISKLYEDGKIKPNTHHISGYYHSLKTNSMVYFKSSYEHRAFELLEHDDNVISYVIDSLTLPYYNPKKQIECFYIVDLLVEYADETSKLIEVKPDKKVKQDKVVQAKVAALQKYSQDNSIPYEIWSETKLFGSEDTEKKMRAYTEWLRDKLHKDSVFDFEITDPEATYYEDE